MGHPAGFGEAGSGTRCHAEASRRGDAPLRWRVVWALVALIVIAPSAYCWCVPHVDVEVLLPVVAPDPMDSGDRSRDLFKLRGRHARNRDIRSVAEHVLAVASRVAQG